MSIDPPALPLSALTTLAEAPQPSPAVQDDFYDLLKEAEALLAQVDPVNTGGFGAQGTLAALLLKMMENLDQPKLGG